MHHPKFQTVLRRAIDQLQEAAWVCRRDGRSSRGLDVLDFATEKLARHFRLREIVYAGAPAAPIGFGEINQFEIRNGFE